MGRSWIVAIEKDGEFLFVAKYAGAVAYIPALMKAARLVDEKIPGASVKVGSLEAKGVVGCYTEWHHEECYWEVKPADVKSMARAARYAGLNYE